MLGGDMFQIKLAAVLAGVVTALGESGLNVDGVPLDGLAAPALLGLFVWLVFGGYLVPRRTYNDMKDDRDYWRQAHAVSEEARGVKDKQLDAVEDIATTVTNFSRALDRVILNQTMGVTQQGEEPHV